MMTKAVEWSWSAADLCTGLQDPDAIETSRLAKTVSQAAVAGATFPGFEHSGAVLYAFRLVLISPLGLRSAALPPGLSDASLLLSKSEIDPVTRSIRGL